MVKSKFSLRLIRKVIQQIVDAHHPRKIVLFGSYAYGRPDRNSDVDLLVIMESKKKPTERAVQVSKSIRFYPFPMDILVRTPKEVEERLRLGDCFYQEVMKQGKLLYER